mgnify:FL=1
MSNPKELVEIVNDVDTAIMNLLEKHQISIMELGSIFTARFVRACQEVGDGDLFVKFCNEEVRIPQHMQEFRGDLH